MALIDRIFGKRKKTLSELDKAELRKEEILLTKQRDRLFKKIETITGAKQAIFKQGATQKSPDLRKALAQDFELKTQEQLMAARELNLRSKELMTVSRLRMVRENGEAGRTAGRLNLTDKDVAKIAGLIEDDNVGQDVYRDRLDTLLDLASAGRQGRPGLGRPEQRRAGADEHLGRPRPRGGQARRRVRAGRPGRPPQGGRGRGGDVSDATDAPMIAYAAPGLTRRPPFDWGAAARQVVFGVGLGFLAAGACWVSIHDPQNDPSPVLFGLGTAAVALTLPWPGRIGRRRRPEGPP